MLNAALDNLTPTLPKDAVPAGLAPRPRGILLIKDVFPRRHVLLDKDEAVGNEGGSTAGEVEDEVLVGELSETPLVPDDVVGLLAGLKVLDPDR